MTMRFNCFRGMVAVSILKEYSFFLWILLVILIFWGANRIYLNYEDKHNREVSAISKPEEVAENKNLCSVKSEENDKDIPLICEFSLNNEKREEISLSDYRGKVVILNFWASWCPPSKTELKEFNKLNSKLRKSKDAVLLTINLTDGLRESKDQVLKFIKDNKYEFTVLFDMEGKISDNFRIKSLPSTIIIDKNGYVHNYIIGATTVKTILSLVEDVD